MRVRTDRRSREVEPAPEAEVAAFTVVAPPGFEMSPAVAREAARRGKGISMFQCEECVLEDVDEYASPGMGILEYQGKGGNVYRRVRIIPPPGTRRLHACAADGFHNAQTDRVFMLAFIG